MSYIEVYWVGFFGFLLSGGYYWIMREYSPKQANIPALAVVFFYVVMVTVLTLKWLAKAG
jgi:TRAP-type C4-dicarboxylate transport system permease small subunit